MDYQVHELERSQRITTAILLQHKLLHTLHTMGCYLQTRLHVDCCLETCWGQNGEIANIEMPIGEGYLPDPWS